jgi:predicted transcriptional regulator
MKYYYTIKDVEELKEKLKRRLYDKLMPDLSGKTQKIIEELFNEA